MSLITPESFRRQLTPLRGRSTTSTPLVLTIMGILALTIASLSGAVHASEAADMPQEKSVIVEYSSVFEGYTEWEWEDVGDWRQANSVVDEIGGWEVYARESEESEENN